MVAGIVAGRLALVTGAGSGLGRAACQLLSREGATVIAADKNYESALETIKTHTALASGANATGDHSAVELNVADSKQVQNLLDTILKQYKAPPTIVVNSAGITRDNWLLKMSEEDYNAVIDVNLKGTFLVMQTFARAMAAASLPGSIINISSIIAKYGNMETRKLSSHSATETMHSIPRRPPGELSMKNSEQARPQVTKMAANGSQTNYAASKAGVIGMTQSAAKELGKSNIRVNAILPGFIKTPMVDTVPEKVIQGMLKLVPLGRMGQPSELAEVITFLASDKSSFVTGAAIDVTGGF